MLNWQFSRSTTIKNRFNVHQPKVGTKKYPLFLQTLSKVRRLAGGFNVHRAWLYVIHQHSRRIDSNNDSNNNNNNKNDNDNHDNNNSNKNMEPETINNIFVFTFTLGLHFPSSFAHTIRVSNKNKLCQIPHW